MERERQREGERAIKKEAETREVKRHRARFVAYM